jgi:hypothetical protein
MPAKILHRHVSPPWAENTVSDGTIRIRLGNYPLGGCVCEEGVKSQDPELHRKSYRLCVGYRLIDG